jgi:3-isopropylmalate/(R)-2-methylmalate dehydratase small subunit
MKNERGSFPALSGRAWYVSEPWVLAAELPSGFTAGDFLVGRPGCGAALGRGSAAALRAAGVGAVIAATIAPAFFAEALAAGLPAVAIEEAAAIKTGDRLRVDIEIFRVANRHSGDRYIIKNLTEEMLETLRKALDG